MKQLFLFIALVCGFSTAMQAQEIQASVSINAPNLQLVDPQVFKDMKTATENFLNNTKWTNDAFEQDERIKINFQFNLREEISDTRFRADLQVQALRPVYGSVYETSLISHQDKDVTFDYVQFQPIIYSANQYNDNLTSILSYYVYVVLGLDYDSFTLYGGDAHFQQAQDILNTVPQSVAAQFKGWRSLDGNRNRYWLIDNILSPRARPYREAMYNYHRQSLDMMHTDASAGRVIMLQALEACKGVAKTLQNSMVMQVFANTKGNEIIEIYKNGDSQQKQRVKQIMASIDGANANKYRLQIGR